MTRSVSSNAMRQRHFRERNVRQAMSCLGFSERRSESNQRQSRNGWDQRSRKTIDRRNGVVSRRVAARTATATSEFMDVTAGETARIQLRTALLQHLRGDGALSDVGSGAVRSHEGRAA